MSAYANNLDDTLEELNCQSDVISVTNVIN
jgi:cell division protein ZapA (FtsZ GTPase activity inhibitor)